MRAVQYLQSLIDAENALLPLELLATEKKSADKHKGRYEQLVSAIKSSHSGVVLGCLVKASTALRRSRPPCESGTSPLPPAHVAGGRAALPHQVGRLGRP